MSAREEQPSAAPTGLGDPWMPCNLRVADVALSDAVTYLKHCGGRLKSIESQAFGYLIRFEHQSFGGDLQMLFSRDIQKGEFRVHLAPDEGNRPPPVSHRETQSNDAR